MESDSYTNYTSENVDILPPAGDEVRVQSKDGLLIASFRHIPGECDGRLLADLFVSALDVHAEY